MKEELIELAQKLKELAIKYEQEYLTITYLEGAVMGNNHPDKEDYISFYNKEELSE